MENVYTILGILVTILGVICLIKLLLWIFYKLPVKMARQRGRDPLAWVLIFLLISPLWGSLILYLAGDYHRE